MKKFKQKDLAALIAGANKKQKISTQFLTQETVRILRDGGFYPFPVKNMGTYSEKAKSFIKSKNNHPGISDIIAVSPEGKFWGVEIKNETTKDKQSLEQMKFEQEVKKRGGEYRLVRNLNDIYKLLETDPY